MPAAPPPSRLLELRKQANAGALAFAALVFFAAVGPGCERGPLVVVAAASLRQRVVARAVVEPRDGVAHVYAGAAGRVTQVSVHEGARVSLGDLLAIVAPERAGDAANVVAPVAGVVLARRASVGDDVRPERGPLFEIADPSRVRLRFELEDDDAARVPVGAAVRVTLRGGAGDPLGVTTVARLSAQMEPRRIGAGDQGSGESRLVRAGWADLEAGERFPLLREVEAVVELPAYEARATLPRDAVTLHEGRTVVWQPARFGDRPVAVRLGLSDAERVEVRGLEAGTQVRRRSAP